MHKQNSFMTSQSETSCLKIKMLHALYNLPARENRLRSRFTLSCHELMSRVWPFSTLFPTIVSGLLCN